MIGLPGFPPTSLFQTSWLRFADRRPGAACGRHQPGGGEDPGLPVYPLSGRRPRLALWKWTRRTAGAAFLALLVLGRYPWFPWIKGTPTSTRLFGFIPFVDPLAGLEVLLASRSATTTLLAGIAATALTAAVFGRIFCGWFCPLGLLLDLNDGLRRRLRRLMRRYRIAVAEVAVPDRTKYGVLLFCLILTAVASVPAFTAVSPINLVAQALVFASTGGLAVIAAILLVEHFSRRTFCRSICPAGALYALLAKGRRLRIWIEKENCRSVSCGHCSRRCPMGLPVWEKYVMPGQDWVRDCECTLCGDCVDGCPGGLLRMGFRRRRRRGQ